MNTNTRTQRVPTRFERQTRFQIEPVYSTVPLNHRASLFEDLKSAVLEPLLEEIADPRLRKQVQLAANEAAAVASTTPFPLLVLPVLVQEKVDEAQTYIRQQEIFDRRVLV